MPRSPPAKWLTIDAQVLCRVSSSQGNVTWTRPWFCGSITLTTLATTMPGTRSRIGASAGSEILAPAVELGDVAVLTHGAGGLGNEVGARQPRPDAQDVDERAGAQGGQAHRLAVRFHDLRRAVHQEGAGLLLGFGGGEDGQVDGLRLARLD